MPFNPKSRAEKYLRKNPDVRTIVVAGAYGRKSALRALSLVLGEVCDVAMGINPKVVPDVLILDYKSSADFPDFDPDIVVVTSCRTEDQAKEFFALADRADGVFVNYNDVPQRFAQYLHNPEVTTYGDELPAHFYFENHDFSINGFDGDIVTNEHEHIPVHLNLLGEHNIRPVLMATAVAKFFGVPNEDIKRGVEAITPLHGRMSPARGLKGTTIIDDSSYIAANAVHQGIATIDQLQSSSKIVITDVDQKVDRVDLQLITDVLVLGKKPMEESNNPKIHYFDDELQLMNYLGTRYEDGGLILLEIPLPEIIQSYIW